MTSFSRPTRKKFLEPTTFAGRDPHLRVVTHVCRSRPHRWGAFALRESSFPFLAPTLLGVLIGRTQRRRWHGRNGHTGLPATLTLIIIGFFFYYHENFYSAARQFHKRIRSIRRPRGLKRIQDFVCNFFYSAPSGSNFFPLSHACKK